MWRSFKYRLYPTPTQSATLHAQVDEACRLYNAALDERKSAWQMQHISIWFPQQCAQLKEIRAAGDISIPSFSVARDVLRRVDKTFARFFQRVKAGEKHPGYPRFQSRNRYDSLTYLDGITRAGAACRRNKRLHLFGVGELKVKWHRPLPIDAPIRSLTVKREAGKWFACFCVEIPDPEPLPASDVAVGIDMGLTTFAVLSDGTEIAKPRHYRLAERRLRVAQRKWSRRQKRSRRRLKARQDVKRIYAHIVNQRRDFQHKAARALVQECGLIGVEDLNIEAIARFGPLGKSVYDAAWGQFIEILSDKAEEAGRTLVKVIPGGTTQLCSGCGEHVPKPWAQRWHHCPRCRLSVGRDLNAARNVLLRALERRPGWGLQAPTLRVTSCVA